MEIRGTLDLGDTGGMTVIAVNDLLSDMLKTTQDVRSSAPKSTVKVSHRIYLISTFLTVFDHQWQSWSSSVLSDRALRFRLGMSLRTPGDPRTEDMCRETGLFHDVVFLTVYRSKCRFALRHTMSHLASGVIGCSALGL